MTKQNGTPFFTEEQKAVIAKTMEGASELDVERFLIICERTGLDPFARQLFGRVQNRKYKDGDTWKYRKELVVITSIDGFRSIAERSGEYAGQTRPEWFYQDDEGKLGWQDVFIPKRDLKGRPISLPEACRVGIHRKGFVEPCYGYANFDSFAVYEQDAQKAWVLGKFWQKMPEHMIAKVAEASGLRKAFPLLVSGLYIEEEIIDEDQPVKSPSTGKELPPGAQWVPGHSPEERRKVIAEKYKDQPPYTEEELKSDSTPTGQRPLPDIEGMRDKVLGRKQQEPSTIAPGASPEPEKAAGKVETPKTTRKPATRQEKRTLDTLDTDQLPGIETPKPEPKDIWQHYVISQITLPQYKGRALSDLTFDELETLKESWVERHAAKIAANPEKKTEAANILLAFNARLDEKLKK